MALSSESRTTEMSFEQAIGQLEQMVRKLESEELDLDEALNAYKEGAELSKRCFAQLKEAEKKIAAVTEEIKRQSATDAGE